VAVLLALGAAAFYGTADFLGGVASRRATAVSVAFVSHLAGLTLILLLFPVVGGAWSVEAAFFGATSGLIGMVGLVLFFDALAKGKVQIVSPVAAVTSAAVPVTAGLLLGDSPAASVMLGLLLAPAAGWLLSGGAMSRAAIDESERRIVLQSIAAGVAFGLFFVLIAQAPDGSGSVPLVSARLASVLALFLVALARRPDPMIPPDPRVAAASGVLDMTANALFLAATKVGDLSVVGALTALFPVGSAILAWIYFHERLDRAQKTGFALAIVAGVLLST
jgi:drug/metabolite transporter (DMT)-like permease